MKMASRENYKILFSVLLLLVGGIRTSAQNSVSVKDSLRFEKIAELYNNCVNTDAKKADSLGHVYLSEARRIGNDNYCGRGATLLNGASLVAGNMKKAIQWRDTAIQYFNKSKNHLWMGYVNLNTGISFDKEYNFDKGLPYLLQSVRDFENAQDYNMVASAYTNIALSNHNFGNYKEGQRYALLAIKTIAKAKDIRQSYKWRAYNALAINYDDDKQWDKAIETHLTALKFADKTSLYHSYNNLGNTYKKKGELKKAMHYLNLSLKNSISGKDDYHYATLYGNIADIYRMEHNYARAEKYVDSALYYSQKSRSPEKLIDAYEFAYLLKNDMTDYKSAAAYLKKYGTLKDSLLDAEKANIIYNYQEQFEAEKRQKVIEEQQFEISRKNYWLIIASVVLVMFCIVAFFMYRSFKHRQDKRLQKEMFRQQEIESKALFEGEQKERIRIARDLHDGVGQMLSLIKMNLSMVDTPDSGLQKTALLVDETIEEVRNVSHNLIPQELNFGIVRALEDIAEKVNASGETKMTVHIPSEIRKLTFEKQNELSIYRIVQEVVSNMIKHAGANRIDLSIDRTEQSITLSIKDNGRGMDQSDLDHSKGLGWKNINARVHLLDGKISIRSEKLSGTQIEITLPGHGE